MPRFLSKRQVEQYHEQGFLSPVDVMSEEGAGGYLEQLQAAEARYPVFTPVVSCMAGIRDAYAQWRLLWKTLKFRAAPRSSISRPATSG